MLDCGSGQDADLFMQFCFDALRSPQPRRHDRHALQFAFRADKSRLHCTATSTDMPRRVHTRILDKLPLIIESQPPSYSVAAAAASQLLAQARRGTHAALINESLLRRSRAVTQRRSATQTRTKVSLCSCAPSLPPPCFCLDESGTNHRHRHA